MTEPLPPRQVATQLFPRIGEREPEPFDPATWSLVVDGLVDAPLELSFDAFNDLPHDSLTGTIHCVTRWSRPGTTFRGVALSTLLALAAPLHDARFVRFESGRGHDSSLPLDLAHEVLIADGLSLSHDVPMPLPPEHGGPVRSVILSRYFYKSVKWVRRIELMAEDRLGTWERTAGYHNGADPWREERYVVRDIDRAELARLLATRDLSGRDLLGVDLSGADLSGFSFAGASLRNARLVGANLSGADLTDASVCNGDLRAADLRGARLSGLDLDGADLRGADLRGALGAPATLAATQFAGSEGLPGCAIDALDWSAADTHGAMPDDIAHLARSGVVLD